MLERNVYLVFLRHYQLIRASKGVSVAEKHQRPGLNYHAAIFNARQSFKQ